MREYGFQPLNRFEDGLASLNDDIEQFMYENRYLVQTVRQWAASRDASEIEERQARYNSDFKGIGVYKLPSNSLPDHHAIRLVINV